MALRDRRPANHFFRVLVLAAPIAASACGVGQQISAGPVMGYTFGRGPSMGWEASGGPFTTTGNAASDHPPSLSSGFTRFSTGMSWRRSASNPFTRERISYLAWEPWFLVGGTAGVASSSTENTRRPLLGIWEGAPYVFGGQNGSGLVLHCGPCLVVSVALGWRWDGAGELYLTPKLGILNGESKPYPFTHVPD